MSKSGGITVAEATTTSSSTQTSSSDAPGGNVLLVDDNGATCLALARVLEGGGYQSATALSGNAALEMLDRDHFDVALVDVVMPNIEGPELIPLLCAKQPGLQVIMMSGSASIEVAVRSLRAGASDFIEKPFRPGFVLAAVGRAARSAHLGRATALYRSSQTIFDAQHFEGLPETIVNVAMQVMSADTASLLLPALDGKLYVAHAYGLDAEVQSNTRVTVGVGIAGKVAESRKPTIINGNATNIALFAEATPRAHVKSSIVYPLVSGSRLVGLITFNRLTDERPYRQSDLQDASVLASQILLALENLRLARQSAISEKLAAVGQLAAGIAHELNTPIQFVGDGLHFLGSAFDDCLRLLSSYQELARRCRDRLEAPELFADTAALEEEVDLEGLREEIPKALAQTTEGVARVASIVRSIKTFGRPDSVAKQPTDLLKLVEATLTVARGEYKYVADVETHFEELPLVPVHPGELGQVILNLVINASHAIGDRVASEGRDARGKITVTGRREGDHVFIGLADTGSGIPQDIREHIFEPFFTTKAVGRGTGLGLSIARGIIVDKHGGELSVQSEVGVGSCFTIRLPAGAP